MNAKIKVDSFWGDLANALLLSPVHREPKKKDSFYGGDNTIHQTGEVNVQLDKHGNVVAVWFRCQMLPFTQRTVTGDYEEGLRSMDMTKLARIKGIVFDDK